MTRTLLNILEEGQLQLTSGGRIIDFRSSLIFMTSNIGSRELLQRLDNKCYLQRLLPAFVRQAWSSRRNRRLHQRVTRRIEARFEPEFINRIDQTLLFNPIAENQTDQLVGIAIEQLNHRLVSKGWRIAVDNETRKRLMRAGFDHRYGARGMRRAVRKMLEVPLAQFLLSHPPGMDANRQQRVALGRWCNGEVKFEEETQG